MLCEYLLQTQALLCGLPHVPRRCILANQVNLALRGAGSRGSWGANPQTKLLPICHKSGAQEANISGNNMAKRNTIFRKHP